MNILGLNIFAHNSSASLLIDGKIIASAEEERFDRIKHSKNTPINSIDFCLQEANLNYVDIHLICIYIKPILYIKTMLFLFFSKNIIHPSSYIYFFKMFFRKKKKIKGFLRLKFPFSKIKFYPHHLCHAYSSYAVSPFSQSAIITVDGRGEYETVCIYNANEEKIKKVFSIKYPHSIGYLYSMITEYLGFQPQSDEYIIMGLSAYGTTEYVDRFRKLIKYNDKIFQLNLKYFCHHKRNGDKFSIHFIQEFGNPRKKNEKIEQRHKDIAYALQFVTEEILLKLTQQAKIMTKQNNLCLAGGVALNCLANQKIVDSKFFDKIFIQPAANDAGTSLGAALLASKKNEKNVFFNPFLGTQYKSHQQIIEIAELNKLKCIQLTNVAQETAKLLYNGHIVAWFQNKMEWGPRSLGNRSLLASPIYPNIKDIINNKIKQREEFRPFAPSIMLEYKDDFFITSDIGEYLYKYMLCTAIIKEDKREQLSAITHIDKTSRVHIVKKEENSLFWDLLNEFYLLSGFPLLLNTSFNISEPIVCSPQDAINTYLKSSIDYLVIDNLLIFRQ